ncbi:phosphoglycerate mutase (2,3-diphosphoglycerate-independent) [Candidatus Giovannonibacteria bacterium RIFCSPLOWO2_01_FULL_46_13]|uniref:2,3-bisphosphoglycerate-independent phosphoglycerate mutase n=1 Tax=Candidatus Giovannonibacteria bacterium RIFCSPLOWO2_01_FULL_46_13 TaxID=1798352 RepID=A0A1F5X4D4_9BACT|nr:MAG: phosphoglycerate mutase (2,3-diphosphoglycerate-independent) [Candidatus Giovannonibacteria bacterium RIFCSPLOWO2_01_FULL_46_13]
MVVLIILDGFGVSQDPESTFWVARRNNFERFEKSYPFTTLQASGIAVGLAWGEEGNSEVGHLILGAGKTIYHHLPRISIAIQDGTFFKNESFKKVSAKIKENNGALHLMGLFSSGSVHAYPDHLYALLEFAKRENLNKVYLHLITDGRDAPSREAKNFVASLEERISKVYPFAKIASIVGRDYAMDRDNDWDKIGKTYNLFVKGEGNKFESASKYLDEEYKKEITDEFIEPGYDGSEESRIKNGDGAIFFNFREDSARELTQAFTLPSFDKFPREKLSDLFFVTMTEYEARSPALAAFGPLDAFTPFAKVLSDNNIKQFHIAETDKYAHVTYFFNGGNESPFPGEDRFLAPSLPSSHYDRTPEMSARKITEEVLRRLDDYQFILINFANADMVGHTGSFEATVKALETLNDEVGKIVDQVLEKGGTVLITGDHGNAEEKRYRVTGEKKTKHSLNPVPLFLLDKKFERDRPREKEEILKDYAKVGGVISDVAPTILELMKIPKPPDMTGISLLEKITKR